jgi:hypothetical protein
VAVAAGGCVGAGVAQVGDDHRKKEFACAMNIVHGRSKMECAKHFWKSPSETPRSTPSCQPTACARPIDSAQKESKWRKLAINQQT